MNQALCANSASSWLESPACVTEHHESLLRPFLAADVAKNIWARRQRHVVVYGSGVRKLVVGRVDDEAEIGLYGASGKNLHVAINRIFLAELLQQTRERALVRRAG